MQEQLSRNRHKTSEGEFIYEMLTSYELSPKMSESILMTAKSCLIRENVLKEGEIEVSVAGIEERSGKTVEMLRKRRVRLTLDNGTEDLEVLRSKGRISLRRIRIQRLSSEALEQEGVLSQEDVARYLNCDVRTIKRDIRAIKKEGIDIITRGVLHNIGRCQTHKRKIVSMYLEGQTFSEIKRRTSHSVESIKRYVQDFVRVLMSMKHGLAEAETVSSVTGMSARLVRQYIDLIEESWKDKQKRSMMRDMVKQWNRAGSRLKKTGELGRELKKSLVPMIGGGI